MAARDLSAAHASAGAPDALSRTVCVCFKKACGKKFGNSITHVRACSATSVGTNSSSRWKFSGHLLLHKSSRAEACSEDIQVHRSARRMRGANSRSSCNLSRRSNSLSDFIKSFASGSCMSPCNSDQSALSRTASMAYTCGNNASSLPGLPSTVGLHLAKDTRGSASEGMLTPRAGIITPSLGSGIRGPPCAILFSRTFRKASFASRFLESNNEAP
mmetsp:Transcript_29233/g.67840  ORF Transcript_29233/g.67840 Transcript_29233/m.67840 type:complete len:216 (-) Transcript_29233:361-1008(-)